MIAEQQAVSRCHQYHGSIGSKSARGKRAAKFPMFPRFLDTSKNLKMVEALLIHAVTLDCQIDALLIRDATLDCIRAGQREELGGSWALLIHMVTLDCR